MKEIKVIVNGAMGKMGQEIVKAITVENDLHLVASLGRSDDLMAMIKQYQADVVVDLTTPQAVFDNAKKIIAAGARPVIGTTGLTTSQIEELTKLCKEKKLGGIIAPNFSLGMILLMRYARDAARYFPDVEIIEMHHEQKLDAPSGTSIKTAQMIAENRGAQKKGVASKEIIHGARGATCEDIAIHSVRLPGLVAHQMVIFGGNNETLVFRHDAIHRQSFMPGVFMSCRKVMELDKLIYGLENVI